MNLLGGAVALEPARAIETSLPRKMAKVVSGASEPIVIGAGAVGFFTTGGPSEAESDEYCFIVHDLDLTNLRELYGFTGLPEGSPGLLGALYRLEGAKCVRRLRGGFALALWDRRKRELLLAVDRFGIKRLHYFVDGARLGFASRVSALLGLPGIERRVDPTAVFHYLNFGYVPSPHSIFKGIRRLPPGHLLSLREGHVKREAYWDLSYPERSLGERDAAVGVYQFVEEAVRQALQGIPPKEAGAFLSGGTDSSTVVGLMGRVTGREVNAFSIGFKEERYNELGYAELAARHFGASHYQKIVTADEAFDAIPDLVEAYDEPFGNNSVIPTYLCARFARECGVNLLLAGDGGDEIFGGNERYRTDQIFARYHRIPSLLRKGVLEPTLRFLPEGGDSVLGKAQRYVRRANIPNPARFYSYEFFVDQQKTALLTPEFLEAVNDGSPRALLEEHWRRAGASSELHRLLYLDMKLTIGDNDLLKVTRAAETAGIGVRFPMLDQSLVEFVGTLPAHYKVRNLEKRYLFKRAFSSLLPREILEKPKHGFGLPVSDWLKSHAAFKELARDTLLAENARTRGYFQPRAIEELFRLHESDISPYYGDRLWVFLMLELWQRRHLDGKGAL